MDDEVKIQIYQGIIQYILNSTHYTLKHIAQLSHTSLENIRKVYSSHSVPSNFKSEIELLKLYQIIREINVHRESYQQAV